MTIRRGTKWGLAGLAAWILLHTLFVVADGLRSSTPPADLAVILGNFVNPDGTLPGRPPGPLPR